MLKMFYCPYIHTYIYIINNIINSVKKLKINMENITN